MADHIYTREYWSGDSKDGVIVNGDGYHYFQMSPDGYIFVAMEVYETDEGDEVVTPLPEMENISWSKDLGFEGLETLDMIDEQEFLRIKELMGN